MTIPPWIIEEIERYEKKKQKERERPQLPTPEPVQNPTEPPKPNENMYHVR